MTVATGIYERKEVVQSQSYGPEARGGACRSDVIISDEPIDYIKVSSPDVFIAMSQQAVERYAHTIDREKAVVIADTTLIRRPPVGINRMVAIDATRISEQTFRQPLFANMILLGALGALSGLASRASLIKAFTGNVPEATLEKNRSALIKGFEIGSGLKTARGEAGGV